MSQLKNISIGRKTTTITLEHDPLANRLDNVKEFEALSILLGGYNKFGRDIPIESYNQIRQDFESCISAIKKQLK